MLSGKSCSVWPSRTSSIRRLILGAMSSGLGFFLWECALPILFSAMARRG